MLTNGNYKLTNNELKTHCTNKCDKDIDKINAVCLWLFNVFFENASVLSNHNNINIVQYIMIWLSYMLSLKSHDKINNLNDFYEMYIKNSNDYNNHISGVDSYSSYKNLIDINDYFLSMNMKIISKFYDAFKILCGMYTNFDTKSPNCGNYLKDAKEFVKKYDELNEDYNNTKGSSYNKILSTLSNDYNNFKKKYNSVGCNHFPSLPTYSRRSVIKNALISISFTFVAVSIFLGIAYKYSLFGFRKRSQKQHLREKLKKIKKKLDH
ncbi:hypothetical protein YYC_02382 [Plasmodium yoelii 17X]|uniref:YIR protein n=1 Tax=Plasmodium yoelii 17X TaxID=1323249 RepID=V7PKL9_PLAYE|nr:hypothetical protein YYC_02382 [Plasmodium yoelii 17X]